jgi:hypothetical protein
MKILITLFFTFCFPVFIFLTTVLYTSDITPLLKSDLVKNNLYSHLSSQLGTINTGSDSSALLGQFIKNKFTANYLQQKVEKAMNDSDDWVTGKSQTPPVISFTDVRDDLNAQYPQLLPAVEQAAEQMKQEEKQNPQLQQNPQAANDLNMIDYLAKSDFTVPLNSYLISFKNSYTTIRILQPALGILLILFLILQCTINKMWPLRLKWIGITLLISSVWGFLLAYGNGVVIAVLTKYLATNTNHAVQIAMPVALQLINHYVTADSSYQKTASITGMIIAAGCFIGVFVTQKNSNVQKKSVKTIKKK